MMNYDMAVIGQRQTLGLTGLEDGTTKITDPEYLEAAKKVEELVSQQIRNLLGHGFLQSAPPKVLRIFPVFSRSFGSRRTVDSLVNIFSASVCTDTLFFSVMISSIFSCRSILYMWVPFPLGCSTNGTFQNGY